MRCPYCSDSTNRVIHSRLGREGSDIRRRRQSPGCGRRFTTRARLAGLTPKVVKPGGCREVHRALRDDQLPENAGDWVLSVEGGRGSLSRGGRGTVHLGVGAFSSLYAGWAGCGVLARAGLVEGAGAEERAALDAAFAGPTPSMLDEF